MTTTEPEQIVCQGRQQQRDGSLVGPVCGRTYNRPGQGTLTDRARAAGWRVGTRADGTPDALCPSCAKAGHGCRRDSQPDREETDPMTSTADSPFPLVEFAARLTAALDQIRQAVAECVEALYEAVHGVRRGRPRAQGPPPQSPAPHAPPVPAEEAPMTTVRLERIGEGAAYVHAMLHLPSGAMHPLAVSYDDWPALEAVFAAAGGKDTDEATVEGAAVASAGGVGR